MPYAMLQKCPVCCENALRRCKNALNILQKCPNFTMHIIIIVIIFIIIIIIIIIIITIVFIITIIIIIILLLL